MVSPLESVCVFHVKVIATLENVTGNNSTLSNLIYWGTLAPLKPLLRARVPKVCTFNYTAKNVLQIELQYLHWV